MSLKRRGCVSSPALSLDIDEEGGIDIRLLRGMLHDMANMVDYRLVGAAVLHI